MNKKFNEKDNHDKYLKSIYFNPPKPEYQRKCSCGHIVDILPKKGKEYVVCSWCKKKVFLSEEKQKEYDKKVQKENFRMKLWKEINKDEKESK